MCYKILFFIFTLLPVPFACAMEQSSASSKIKYYESRLMKECREDLSDLQKLTIGYGIMRECKDAQGATGLPPVLSNIVHEYCNPTNDILNQYCACGDCCFCPQNQWPVEKVLLPGNKTALAWNRANSMQETLEILKREAREEAIKIVQNEACNKKSSCIIQ